MSSYKISIQDRVRGRWREILGDEAHSPCLQADGKPGSNNAGHGERGRLSRDVTPRPAVAAAQPATGAYITWR
jgi:hypothetical protein